MQEIKLLNRIENLNEILFLEQKKENKSEKVIKAIQLKISNLEYELYSLNN